MEEVHFTDVLALHSHILHHMDGLHTGVQGQEPELVPNLLEWERRDIWMLA